MPRGWPSKLIWIAVAACPLMAQQFHIDHVTVAGRDLEHMRKALRAAGIESEYGGPHSNHATEMALASFPDGSYLELIAIQPHADPVALSAHYWYKFLESDGSPCAWAIRPADFGAELQRLRKASAAVTDPNKNGRKRPDGLQLEWETAQVGPTNGGFFPFLIHDFTPRDRRAFPAGKPTTSAWTGVVKVVIGVRTWMRRLRDIGAPMGCQRPSCRKMPGSARSWPGFQGRRLYWPRLCLRNPG